MRYYNLLILALIIGTVNLSWGQSEKKYIARTIAFYNVENLFDTINDPKNP